MRKPPLCESGFRLEPLLPGLPPCGMGAIRLVQIEIENQSLCHRMPVLEVSPVRHPSHRLSQSLFYNSPF